MNVRVTFCPGAGGPEGDRRRADGNDGVVDVVEVIAVGERNRQDDGLATRREGKRVWLLFHIPPGIDVHHSEEYGARVRM